MLAYAREFRGGASRTIVANAASLVGTTVITSVLGFGYWLLAARLFSARELGLAAAAISAMTLLGIVGMLGLGTLLIGELQRRPGREGSLITTALLVAGGAGALLGLGFVTVAPLLSKEFEPLAADPLSIGVFALGASLTAVALVVDAAVIGLLRGGLQLVRNTVFSVAKLALLFGAALVFSWRLWLAIFATWVFGNLVSLLAIAMITVRRRHLTEGHRPQLSLVRVLGRSAIAHHSLNLALQLPSLALPLIVTLTLTATRNASFYIAWTISSFAFAAPVALATVLYAVGSASPSTLTRNVRVTVGLTMVAAIVAAALILVAGTSVLRIFGAGYSAQAAGSLRILTLAVFPLAIRSHYVTLSRIRGHLARAALLVAAGALLELVLAVVGAWAGGLSGLSLAWLGALLLEGLVTFPAVYRAAVNKALFPEVSSTLAMTPGPTITAVGGIPAFEVIEFADEDAFARLRQDWNAISSRMEIPAPFQSWEWNAAWWRHFGRNRRLRMLLFQNRGRPVGIAQFFEERYVPLGSWPRVLIPLGWEDSVRKQGLTEQWELLFPQSDQADLMNALGTWLSRNRWTGAVLPSLSSSYPLPAWVTVHSVAVSRPVSSLYRPLPDSWEALLATLTKSMRDNVKYYPRLLERHGHRASYQVASTGSEISASLPILFEAHRTRAQAPMQVKHADKFQFADRRAFLTEVSQLMATSSQIRIGMLRVDDQVVAAQMWLEQRGTMFLHTSGFATEWASYSVGMIATLEAIKDGIARGLTRVEFLRGEYQSKERWGTTKRTHAHVFIGNNSSLLKLVVRPRAVRRLVHFEGTAAGDGVAKDLGVGQVDGV